MSAERFFSYSNILYYNINAIYPLFLFLDLYIYPKEIYLFKFRIIKKKNLKYFRTLKIGLLTIFTDFLIKVTLIIS